MAATKLNLTNEQLQNIFDQYYSGVLPSIIEAENNFASGTIKYLRKKHNKPVYVDPRFTDEYISKAVNELVSGILLKDVIAKYNICESVITNYMKKHNIEYKNDHGRKNHFNKNYFDTIDSERKAYWLGFIYADGCIAKTDKSQTRANRLIINISQRDRCILEEFLKDIESENVKIQDFIPKGTYSSNPMSRIYLNSVELCDALQRCQVHESKTGNTIFPSLFVVPKNLQRDFIRGFFDGDGSLSSTTFSIIGDKKMLIPLQEILMKNCSLNKTKLIKYPHKSTDIFDLSYGGRLQCLRIKDYLYKDATIYLQRKYEKFQSLLS